MQQITLAEKIYLFKENETRDKKFRGKQTKKKQIDIVKKKHE